MAAELIHKGGDRATVEIRITRDSYSDDQACYQRKQAAVDRAESLHGHHMTLFRSLCSSRLKIDNRDLGITRSEARP
jgi:hypothetical protein